MPWDGTRLCLGKIESRAGNTPRLFSIEQLLAGMIPPVSQPKFSPDGKFLSYIVQNDDWDTLEVFDLESKEKSALIQGEGFHLAKSAWVQGNHEYAWNCNGDSIFYTRLENAFTTLWKHDVKTKQNRQIDASPYSYLHQISASPVAPDDIVFIASGPSVPDRIVRYKDGQFSVIRRSSMESLSPAYFAVQKPITWQANDGTTIDGLYQAPTHPTVTGEGLPPVIVNIHGGPTSLQYIRYNATAAYFTSRGYGWLDVHYRGSTGYGRSYQTALYRRGPGRYRRCYIRCKGIASARLGGPQANCDHGGECWRLYGVERVGIRRFGFCGGD